MTLKNDLLKHRILVQQYAAKQARKYSKRLRAAYDLGQPLNLTTIYNRFEAATSDFLGELLKFADYESGFYVRLLEKYFKKTIDKVEIRDIILESKVAYSVKQRPLGIRESFQIFTAKKIQEIRQLTLDNPENITTAIPELLAGRITNQANAMIVTSVNGVLSAVRLKY